VAASCHFPSGCANTTWKSSGMCWRHEDSTEYRAGVGEQSVVIPTSSDLALDATVLDWEGIRYAVEQPGQESWVDLIVSIPAEQVRVPYGQDGSLALAETDQFREMWTKLIAGLREGNQDTGEAGEDGV